MKRFNGLFAGMVLGICATTLQAADIYPTRPVRIIVPTGAGGITDILARVIGQKLRDSFGQQPVIIENRVGASGIVGSQVVANSPPDGYTLLMVFPTHVVNPSLFPDIPYDTVKAFSPITLVSSVASTLMVNAATPVKSVAELIALAKAKPGQLNYGDVGSGSLVFLSAELFSSLAGIKLTQVSYKGVPQSLAALLAGEIHMTWVVTAGTVLQQEKAGKVRLLGVTSKERRAAMPHVPPMADAVPGYEAIGWNGILGPAGMAPALVERLNQDIVRIVRSPEFGQNLVAEGATAVGNTPPEFDAIIRADIQKWAALLKSLPTK
jgi:tripartite-type tricarboxylate transporter receptor subunit TctC